MSRATLTIHPAYVPALRRWGSILAIIFFCVFVKGVVTELRYHGPVEQRGDTDFLNVWAAGSMASSGRAAEAYDWKAHRAVEVAVLGYDFGGYYGWHYPPFTLFLAQAIALLPYAVGWAVYVAITLTLYVVAIRFAFGHRYGYLLAFATPCVAWNAYLGQNGFLTTALIAGIVLLMDRRPLVAGLLLGLLAYKPQFGLLFPLILLLEGRWRMIAVATLTIAAMASASLVAYGIESWYAFMEWMSVTAVEVFGKGEADLGKMHSVLGVMRLLGVPLDIATAIHVGVALRMAFWVVALRRRCADEDIRMAALALGPLFITPYVYIYDLVLMSLPLALFLRVVLHRGMTRTELLTVVLIVSLLLIFPLVTLPLGLLATLFMAWLIDTRSRQLSA
jgi:hypothetical protein